MEIIGGDTVLYHVLANAAEDQCAPPEGLSHQKMVNHVGGTEIPTEKLKGPEEGMIKNLILFHQSTFLDARVMTIGRHDGNGRMTKHIWKNP